MTKIKLCGLTRDIDIENVNKLNPDYIGFVFAKKSRRYVSLEKGEILRSQLNKDIVPVGVFVNEDVKVIAELVKNQVIEVVQLHGKENEEYINDLRKLVKCKIIKAFQIKKQKDVLMANNSSADYVLLDSGGGTGEKFDWSLIKEINRPYFLAGGLTSQNVKEAILDLQPFGVDASSSLETEGFKDIQKMTDFVKAVRGKENKK